VSGVGFFTASLIVTQPPFEPGNGPLDHDQAAVGVGAHDLQVLRRHPHRAHVAGHLLALEHLAGVLALAGRAVAAVADRDTVRRAQAAEVVPLHGAGEALADARARDVDELAGEVVVGGDLLADADQVLGGSPGTRELALGLDLGSGEVAAHRLADVRFALAVPAPSWTAE
jgi:hypothetical protein